MPEIDGTLRRPGHEHRAGVRGGPIRAPRDHRNPPGRADHGTHRAAEGIALATGTRVEVARASTRYAHFRNRDVLSATFAEHLSHAGMTVKEPAPGICLGSSGIGNVSARVPAIHPFVAILGPDESAPRFAEAAGGPDGRKARLAAAQALARTAADVLLRPELGARAWSELRRKEAAGR